MHVIVNKDHRESSWNSVGAFLDDFRTINLDLGPKSRFSAPGPTSMGNWNRKVDGFLGDQLVKNLRELPS